MKLKYCCIFVLALMLGACGNDLDYRNALPSRSSVVVSVDLASISGKASLSGNSADGKLQARLKTLFKSGLSGVDGLVDKVFDDVAETGLGLDKKVYLFSNGAFNIGGLLVKVDDEDKFEDLLEVLEEQNVCGEIKDTDGCKWTVVGDILVAYKSHAMLFVADYKDGNPSSLARQASMWLRQKEGDGFSSTSDFRLMDERKAEIVAWNTLEAFPREVVNPIVMGIPAGLELNDMKAVSTVDFNKGKITVDVETIFDNDIMNSVMEDRLNVISPIKGHYLDMFPSNTALWAAVNIKGGEFFSSICGNPLVKRYFERSMLPVDFASVFDAIEGDVVLAVSGTGNDGFIAFADVKSDDFLSSFEPLKNMASMSGGQAVFKDHGENGYEFKIKNGSIVGLPSGFVALWIGVKDNKFYITNKESFIDRRVLGLSLRDKEWGNRVEGAKLFLKSDFSSIGRMIGMESNKGAKNSKGAMSYVLGLLGGLDYFTVESADGKNLHVEFLMKNKNRNPLSVMLNR